MGKAIYIIIGVLVVILLIIMFTGKKTDAAPTTGAATAGGSESQMAGVLSELLAGSSQMTAGQCKQECSNLCASCSYFGGGRLDCDQACKSDCTKGGIDIRTRYPNC